MFIGSIRVAQFWKIFFFRPETVHSTQLGTSMTKETRFGLNLIPLFLAICSPPLNQGTKKVFF